MKAAVLDGNARIHIEEREMPLPPDDGVVVKVVLTSLCGTDVDVYRNCTGPQPSGHEFVGTVCGVGAKVTRFAKGDRVVATWGVGCGACEDCSSGRPNLCDNLTMLHGAHAEYIAVPRADMALAHLPEAISWQAGIVMACSLSTALYGVEISSIGHGETVAVLGLGPVGLCMILAADALGARRIVAADMLDYRRRKALELGATEVGDPTDEKWFRSQQGTAAVVLLATANPAAVETAVYLARKGGRITVMGSQISATVPFERFDQYGLHLHGTWSMLGGGYMKKVVDCVSAAKIHARQLEGLVTHEIPLSQIARAFELFASRDQAEKVLKVAIRP